MGASIEVNGSTGPATVPIGDVVSLANASTTTTTSQKWEILSYPDNELGDIDDGNPDFDTNFSSWTVGADRILFIDQSGSFPDVVFTPDISGTYLIRLTSHENDGSQKVDTTIAYVPDSYTGMRLPTIGERLEANDFRGWGEAEGLLFRSLARKTNRSTYIRVAQDESTSIARGSVVRLVGVVDARTIAPNIGPDGTHASEPEFVAVAVLATDPHAPEAVRGIYAVLDEELPAVGFANAIVGGMFDGRGDVSYTATNNDAKIYAYALGAQSSSEFGPIQIGQVLDNNAYPDGGVAWIQPGGPASWDMELPVNTIVPVGRIIQKASEYWTEAKADSIYNMGGLLAVTLTTNDSTPSTVIGRLNGLCWIECIATVVPGDLVYISSSTAGKGSTLVPMAEETTRRLGFVVGVRSSTWALVNFLPEHKYIPSSE